MRNRNQSGVIQIIIVAGISIVIFGLFWIAATAPVSSIIAQGIASAWFDSDMLGTVLFIQVFILLSPLLFGLSVTAWGWVKTVEERETGFSSF